MQGVDHLCQAIQTNRLQAEKKKYLVNLSLYHDSSWARSIYFPDFKVFYMSLTGDADGR